MSTAEAQKRLQKAFDKLEATARRLKDRAHSEAAASIDLGAEMQQLRTELEQARAANAELEHKNQEASLRVGAAMDRLKAVLEA